MMMRKNAMILAASVLCIAFGMASAAAETEREQTQNTEVTEIATADELKAVNDNLSGNYVLTADIDLEGAEWTPLGSFVQMGAEGEEAETPDPEYAFTGTFDGQGHTISNFTINQPDNWALGLFGCIANMEIRDFNVDHVQVDGTTMASSVVGYSFCSTVSGIKLSDALITAHATDMSAEGMYGGIVGAGMMSRIENCTAAADIVMPDKTANAGIIGGGLELTSVTGSSAAGSITAGNECYGIGGISGCGFGAEEFTDCTAENVTINAGDNCYWIGGLTGYAGGYEEEEAGIQVTEIAGCTIQNVTIQTGGEADGIGEIVGAGTCRSMKPHETNEAGERESVLTIEKTCLLLWQTGFFIIFSQCPGGSLRFMAQTHFYSG